MYLIFCFVENFYLTGVQYDRTSPGFKALSKIATLCNRAEFKGGQEGIPILKRFECFAAKINLFTNTSGQKFIKLIVFQGSKR